VTAKASPIRTTENAREVPLTDLRPHPGNPRRITQARLEQLQRTLTAEREMLHARPLIALPDGTVIAGNQRLAAAVALGWESIPVVYADLDAATARRWMLLDNRPAGEDDVEALAQMLRELDAGQQDLAGYAAADVDAILRAAQPLSPRDPDEAPPVPVEAKSRPGEVYELGPHRLLCGDACDLVAVRALVGSCAPEVLWTDPPYGVSYVGKTRDALTIENDKADGLRGLLDGAFAAADQVLAASGRVYCAAPPGPRSSVFQAAFEGAGWHFHQGLIWLKDVMVLGHADYHYRHEPILYGWKPGAGRAGRGAHEGSRWYGGNAQTSVFEIARPKRSADHPTMKPVDLVAACLANSSRISDGILDPFGGSGTTLIAAEMLDRRAFLVELDPAYCDVIRQRYADYVGDQSLAP
jgi:DNA modification methylase